MKHLLKLSADSCNSDYHAQFIEVESVDKVVYLQLENPKRIVSISLIELQQILSLY